MNIGVEATQRELCNRYGVPFFECTPNLKVGISRNVKDGLKPLNGLRIAPTADNCGWYFWAGEEWSSDPDFFVPLHVSHLDEWVPLASKFLGLPPGWRFLVTEDYEDVWQDSELLK